MTTFKVSELDKMVKTVTKFARKNNYTGIIDRDNIQDIIKACAENMPDLFAEFLARGYDFAVRQYEHYVSPETRHFEENYHLITENLDNIFKVLDIETDYSGLYPCFELSRGGKHFTEYSTLGALRQYNNFWNHWTK